VETTKSGVSFRANEPRDRSTVTAIVLPVTISSVGAYFDVIVAISEISLENGVLVRLPSFRFVRSRLCYHRVGTLLRHTDVENSRIRYVHT